jgi:hypothetical protein
MLVVAEGVLILQRLPVVLVVEERLVIDHPMQA